MLRNKERLSNRRSVGRISNPSVSCGRIGNPSYGRLPGVGLHECRPCDSMAPGLPTFGSSRTVNTTPVQIQAHPPERRQRPVVVAPCCCCCCCCCCLHTLGSLTGAAMGSVVRSGHYSGATLPSEEEFWARSPQLDRAASEHAAVRLYWYLLVGVATLMGLVLA